MPGGSDVLGTASIPIRARLDQLSDDLQRAQSEVTRSTGETGERASRSFSQRFQRAGQRMQSVGQRMTKRVTVPLLAVGAAAVKAADDVTDAMNKIKVGTGASGDELAGLQGVAKKISKQVPASIHTVAEAVASLNTATGATGDTLDDLAKNVLEASRLMGEDGAANAQAFGKALRQWNVPASEGVGVLKTLYAAGQKYGLGLGEQMKLLNAYGPILANAGFSMKESAVLFGQMQQAGLEVSRLMPGLNMAFRKWAQEQKDPQRELARTVAQIKNAKSSTEALAVATDAFGAEGAQRLVTAIRQSGVSFDNLSKSLDTSNTDIIETGKNTRTLGERLQVLKNKASLALAKFGAVALPAVTKGLDLLGSALDKVIGFFSGLSDGTKKFLGIAAGIAAALGPGLTIVGKLTSKLGSMFGTFRKVSGGAKSFVKNMRAGALSSRQMAGGAALAATALIGVGMAISKANSVKLSDVVGDGITALKGLEEASTAWRDALVQSNGVMTKSIRLSVAKRLQDAGLAKSAHEAGISITDLTDAVAGGEPAMEALIKRWRKHGEVSKADQVALTEVAKAYANAKGKAKALAPAVKETTDAQKKQGEVAGPLQKKIDGVTQKLEEQKKAADKLKQSILKLGETELALSSAQDGFKASLDELTQSVKDNGTSLSSNTAKGRANRDALRSGLRAALDYAKAQSDNGVAIGKVTDKLEGNVAQLIKTATRAGLSKKEVHKLVREMNLTPKQIETTFVAHMSKADRALRKFKRLIEKIPATKDITLRTHLANSQATKYANRLGRAAGGPINGPGPRGVDSVPLLGAPGEWVINDKAVRALQRDWGADVMRKINRGQVPAKIIPAGTGTGGGAPLIGELTLMTPQGATARDMIDELTFELERIKAGGRYARA